MERDKVETACRRAMTEKRKLAIHERAGGVCWLCSVPVEATGPDVEYDHRIALWITGDDSDAGIFPVHKACHANKTKTRDIPMIAKTKRLIRKADPETRKPSRMQSRGFQTGLTKGFDGKVRPRKKSR